MAHKLVDGNSPYTYQNATEHLDWSDYGDWASVNVHTGEITTYPTDTTNDLVVTDIDVDSKTITVGSPEDLTPQEKVEPLHLTPMPQPIFDEYQRLLGVKVTKPRFSARHPRLTTALQWAATLGICGAALYAAAML